MPITHSWTVNVHPELGIIYNTHINPDIRIAMIPTNLALFILNGLDILGAIFLSFKNVLKNQLVTIE